MNMARRQMLSQATLAALALALAARTQAGNKPDLAKLFGKIQFVESFPDYKVKIVESFADLHVKIVDSFPDGPGKWKLVNSFPDFKLQMVESFPDFTIKYVDSFPGVQ